MKNVTTPLLFSRLALSTVLVMGVVSASFADDVNLKTMIPGVPQIDAESYILIDYNSGKVLAEMNADARRDPASLTKMMTSYVIGQAIKAGKITPNDMVTVNKDAWATGNPVFKGSSLMFLKPGDRVPVSQLNRGIILQSGNDACVTMADYVAGSQDAFVGLMNNYVSALGLQNTHFETVHGLDASGQFSSARDMAMIGKALIRDVPDEYATYKEKEFTFNNIRQMNRNGLLWDSNLNVDGIKTGHTESAGYNLVASATEGQMRLISAVLGGHSMKGRENESRKLLTWGFRFFETVAPLKAGKEFAADPVWFGDTDSVKLGVDNDAYLTIPRGRMKDLKASYVLNNQELHAPLAKNQQVGTINFQLDGKTIEQRPLVVLSEVKEGNFFSRMVDHVKLMFHHWFG
ncbi:MULTISPECIES: D-alanyl-D-alanine carboxypeptidase DacA [Enterobacterales]|uniref:serine-type D-Ala-D-Ala carboxypeptidase n=1 Tax=Candidatus Sodalis endolongispinus TaxID=2812662 RepID=A0ABS5YC46_9GAMM|nr:MULTISPECIES: D-alanyl-D-alanine carboxypeptidase DacA [Enterobacterales]MBG6247531.1 serine-type D-Ala-D-Ala carboxypeptidase [Candidatus Symbiopectobacterium sp. PLON1]MBT9432590.1 D-alanyl-D-alanine carboxypeptidase DacA [Candidatus Sodalis endolongispinus]